MKAARGRGGGAVGDCSWWEGFFLRTGKEGMGEELFCASAGGGRVGGPETSHGASGGFGNGAGDGLVRPRGLLGFGFGLCSWVV